MTLSVTWRSTRKFPSNVFCVRAFARELKAELIGEIGSKPQYPEVERAFQEHTGAELGRATWSEWWNGRRVPNATYRMLIDNAFDGLATKWLYRSLDHGRLQRHLSAFDLGWIHAHQPGNGNVSEAWRFLLAIFHEWAPWRSEMLFFPNAVSRAILDEEDCKDLFPDPSSLICLQQREGSGARLALSVRRDTTLLLDPLSPASVIPYLLSYAAESRLPGDEIREAFILDLLTAVNACLVLLQASVPDREDMWGRTGMIARDARDVFWMPDTDPDDPSLDRDEYFERRAWSLIVGAGLADDFDAVLDLLRDLEDIYYRSLAVTGGDPEQFVEFAQKNSGISTSDAR